MKKIILVIGLLLFFFHVGLCQKSTARFLLYQPSARSSAMAGSGSLIHDNAFAIYYNPATLINASKFNVVGSFQKPIPFFGNIAHAFIASSYNIETIGVIAASANLYWPGPQIWIDDTVYELGGMNNELNWQGKVSFARQLNNYTSIGVSLGYLNLNLVPDYVGVSAENRGSDGNTILMDFSVLLKNIYPQITFVQKKEKNNKTNQNSGLSIGIVFRNIGPINVTQINKKQSDPLPGQIIAGLLWPAFKLKKIDIDILLILEKQLAESSILDYFRFGTEVKIQDYVYLRAGYALDAYGIKNSFPTVGIGFKYKFISFDFAYFNNTFEPNYHYGGSLFLDEGF